VLNGCRLPKMGVVWQKFPVAPPLDIPAVLAREFETAGVLAQLQPGARVAVAVGSRGITDLARIVRTVIDLLRQVGASPFIVPAMGSHGGATPEGQVQILADYGVGESQLGVPVAAAMEVEQVGLTEEGRPIYFSTAAQQADGIVVINRVKPHTDFGGDFGSGILKMLAIGLGKLRSAALLHEEAARLGHARVFRHAARVVLRSAPVLCGVAVVEGAVHETLRLSVLRPDEIELRERELLEQARDRMARLPFRAIDLLIIDRMGKDISGAGIDSNVIGRDVQGYSSALDQQPLPVAYRVFVRNLTPFSHGNAVGIGLADFTTSRLVRAIESRKTYVNALTALVVPAVKIPIHFDTDREVIEAALTSMSLPDPRRARVVRIVDTLSLERMEVSEALFEEAHGCDNLAPIRQPREMEFDVTDNLLPLAACDTSTLEVVGLARYGQTPANDCHEAPR
jgi:hypothetical protein